MNVEECRDAIYFLTFIDDHSQHGYVCLLSHSYEVVDVFMHFVPQVETQLEQKVNTLRTDCGREYLSNIFN